MQLDPLPEQVRVTIFMEGLRTGIARTEVFRVHPSTFEEAVDIALNAEFNFKAARYGTHGHAQRSFDGAEPMDLSHAEEEERALLAVEQQRKIRRCYMCGSTKHLRPQCPLRKPLQSRPSRNPPSNPKVGTERENGNSQ
uniref:CCHC-type domain-containing protein n=1 Tax=Peronospora matthiolae TaxID=2874970 RepID=A0AAV1TZI5_9STRA